MHREADVLQHRIEVAPLDRRGGEPRERVGGHQDEEIEGGRDPGLHREHAGAQRQRQIVAEQRDHGAEQRQDRHPQQHRAFVVPPHAGDLVEQRLHRVRILEHVGDGEIRGHVQGDQRDEGQAGEDELRQCRRAADIHQRNVALMRAKHRHGGLDQRQRERQHQGIMSALCNHWVAPAAVFSPSRIDTGPGFAACGLP